jgi:hypothetical protein
MHEEYHKTNTCTRQLQESSSSGGGGPEIVLGTVIDAHEGFTLWRFVSIPVRLILQPFETMDAESYAELIAERGPGARGFGTTGDEAG